MRDALIVSTARTPLGKSYRGTFNNTTAPTLAGWSIEEAVKRSGIDPNKVNILWQKNSWDQPNLQKFFSNKSRHHEYDWYIFNSHWNYEKFRYFFNIPTERSIVIKNGIDNFPIRKIYKKGMGLEGRVRRHYN